MVLAVRDGGNKDEVGRRRYTAALQSAGDNWKKVVCCGKRWSVSGREKSVAGGSREETGIGGGGKGIQTAAGGYGSGDRKVKEVRADGFQGTVWYTRRACGGHIARHGSVDGWNSVETGMCGGGK
jgi:hypothetical protein